MAFAGLDVGTSGSKMLVYNLKGQVIFRASGKYEELGGNGYRELDPDMVMAQVKKILREVGENCPEPVEAMAVTSLGESIVCMSEDGRVLANAMLTGDSRGIFETREIVETIGARRVMEITGLPPNELYGLPKYMWLNRNTDAIKNASAIFFFEDFIGYMLTGKRMVSCSSAARSMAFDIRTMKWSEELLRLAGIRKEQMSVPVKPCTIIGTILPEAARELNLNPDMKLVAGGHDQICAALGSGLVGMETAECSMGTCEYMFLMLPEPNTAPFMIENNFPCVPYLFPGKYLSGLEVTTCGALKNWAGNTILEGCRIKQEKQNANFFEQMDQLAKEIKTEVLILPQFGSAGTPDLSMDARGTITGLTIHTKVEEIYRAILEGMAFQMYLAYDRIRNLGTAAERIVATGGGAASELALQIRADVFGMKVVILENSEAGTLGCMMMAATAMGAYPSLEEAVSQAVRVKKEYMPDGKMHRYYKKKFEKYKKLYERMRDFK